MMATSSEAAPTLRIADLIGVLVVVTAAGLSVMQWKLMFADLGVVAPTLGAAVVAGAVVLLTRRLGWSKPTSFIATTAALLATAATVYQADIAGLPGDIISSWKGLATTGLLIPGDAEFVLVPLLTVGMGTWLAGDHLLRKGTAVPSALLVLTVHAIAIAYSAGLGQPPTWYLAAVALLVGLLLVIAGLGRPGGASYDGRPTAVGTRQLASSGIVVLLLAGLAGGLGLLFDSTNSLASDSGQSFDLRERLVRPIDITDSATPLSRVKAGLVDPDNETVFTIRLDGLTDEDVVRLLPVAVLDRYDGSIWTSGARFEPAGALLPRPVEAPPNGAVVSQRVTLTNQYPFRFLPTAGTVRTLDDRGMAWDPSTGTLASIDPDTADYRADVALVLPNQPGTGEGSAASARTSDKSDLSDDQRRALSAYLSGVVSANDDPVEQLRQLEADLRTDSFGYNIEAPAGHSLAALVSYLAPESTDEDGVSGPPARVGFAEHSAASFAVLARELGIPSRVVVGYRLEEGLTSLSPEALVTNNMIHAWPEAWLPELGWIRFEPTNRLNQTPEQASRTPSVSSAGIDANRSDLPDLEEPILLTDDGPGGSTTRAWWIALLLLLPLVYLTGVVVAKRLRRSRRRAKKNSARVVGAWQETQDRFRELGLPSSASLSVIDVVDELDTLDLRDVGDTLNDLADPLDSALYAPVDASPEQATQAWAAADAAIGQARKQASRRDRARALADPRSLVSR